MDIKIEVPFSETISQTERESFSPDVTMKLNSVYIKMCKREIIEEGVESDFSPQNKRQCCFEVPAATVNPCNDSELDTKIEIKEELQWQETTSAEVPNVDEDCVDESFPSTESIRLYREEASRDKSDLLSKEYSENNKKFNMTKDRPECEIARKYINKKIDVPETSSVQKSAYPEKHDNVQMVNRSLYLKYNNVIQQNGMQMNVFNKQNYCYESDSVRDNKCNTCGKCFTRLTHLKRHKLTHDSIEAKKCSICGKCFTQMHHLRRHKLTHEGLKPHKCDICGKSFIRLNNLNHEGLKPNKCDICGKCFSRLNSFKKL